MLDEGLNLTSNAGGHKAWQMSSVDMVTSRWGLKGSEDLGDGLQAIFDLESGFMLDNGAAYYNGRMFGYQSYVGLQSDTFGTLTFGRQFDSITDVIGPMTANGYWGGYLFSHPLDNDNTDATFRPNNSVKFTSIEYGGLSASALYGFSNQAGSFAGNRMYSAGLKYSYGTFTIGAVYENLSDPGATSTGAVASDEANFVAAGQKIYGIGASYGAGPATLGLVYTHVNVQQPVSSLYLGDLGVNDASLRFDNVEFNAKYDVLVGCVDCRHVHVHDGASEARRCREFDALEPGRRDGSIPVVETHQRLYATGLSEGEWRQYGNANRYGVHSRRGSPFVEFASDGGANRYDAFVLIAVAARKAERCWRMAVI